MAIKNGNDNDNTLSGTSVADAIYGYGGNDTLSGLGGDDYIDGGDGNDTLTGGTGNDTLYGGDGSDTYVFSKGDGSDTINNLHYDGSKDVVKFTDVPSTAVASVRSNGNDLVIALGGTDKITLANGVQNGYAYDPNYPISQMQFSDGVTWTWENLLTQSLIGNTGNDTLNGYNDRDDTRATTTWKATAATTR